MPCGWKFGKRRLGGLLWYKRLTFGLEVSCIDVQTMVREGKEGKATTAYIT